MPEYKRIARGIIQDQTVDKEFDHIVKQSEDHLNKVKAAVNKVTAVTPATVTAEELGEKFNELLSALKGTL